MIEYEYLCSSCDKSFVVTQSIKDKALTSCILCGGNVERVIYGGLGFSISHEPTTIGQLAERNTKSMGKMELQEKRAELKHKRKLAKQMAVAEATGGTVIETPESHNPVYGKCPIPNIAAMPIERQNKYILEGK